MSRVFVLSLAATLVLAACADNILKERPVRSASTSASAPSLSVTSHSSICSAYRRQLQQVKVAQSLRLMSARKAALHARELSLNAVIADACE